MYFKLDDFAKQEDGKTSKNVCQIVLKDLCIDKESYCCRPPDLISLKIITTVISFDVINDRQSTCTVIND